MCMWTNMLVAKTSDVFAVAALVSPTPLTHSQLERRSTPYGCVTQPDECHTCLCVVWQANRQVTNNY